MSFDRAGLAGAVDVLIPTCGRPGALAVTLAGLAAQRVTGFRALIADQTWDGPPAVDAPEVTAVVRVLRARGCAVELYRRDRRYGMAEQRQFLLDASDARYVLQLDDDILLDPGTLPRLLTAIGELGCGFVGAAPIGLSYAADRRPAELAAFERWDGPVRPETVRKDTPGWDRWQLHNAANALHLAEGLELDPSGDGWVAYKVAWIAGCVLFDAAALRAAGGFLFWPRLPLDSAGEDVVSQLRVQERFGAAGILPSGAYHLELPTQVGDRRVDAYAEVLGNPGDEDAA